MVEVHGVGCGTVEDLQTTPACSIIVRPSCIHCFTCCCCSSTMSCKGPLRSPRAKRVGSEAWRMRDRNEMKMGLGAARAPKGADAARTMGAAKRIAVQCSGGWVQDMLKPKVKLLFSGRRRLLIYKANEMGRRSSSKVRWKKTWKTTQMFCSRARCIPSRTRYCARSLFVACLNKLFKT